MIQLANSGQAGTPISADGAVTLTAIPVRPSPKPLNEEISFSDMMTPTPVKRASINGDVLPTLALDENELASEGLPQLPNTTLPGGKNLPVAAQMPKVIELPLPDVELAPVAQTSPVIAPNLAGEDVSLERPKLDRLPSGQESVPNRTSNNAAVPQSFSSNPQLLLQTMPQAAQVSEPTPLTAGANRQISNLALAAAQVLSASKAKPSGEHTVAPSTVSRRPIYGMSVKFTEAPLHQSPPPTEAPKVRTTRLPNLTPMPEPAKTEAKTLGKPSRSASNSTTVTDVELPLKAKSPSTRNGAEPLSTASQFAPSALTQTQAQASTPAQTTAIIAANGELTTAVMPDSKPAIPQPARADQQASLDRFADQVASAREAAQPGSANIRLPHDQFGQIRMQLELAGAGLKVSLGNSDPGFASSVQLALAERVSSVSDASRSESSGARQDTPQQNSQASGNGANSGSGHLATQHSPHSQSQADAQPRESRTFEEALFGEQPNASSTAEHSPELSAQDGLFA